MQQHYIEDQKSLNDLCEQLSHSKILAVDTEFVRTRTLFPKLGLLQVCNGEHLALIDPIFIADLSAFWQLMTDASITKVLHACSEDLEVLLTCANCRPVNVIDTQIMMSFLGHGLSLGYAAMVEHYLQVSLDKSESRTDWTKRPLSAKQLDYARADVSYLFQLYPKIEQDLSASGWLAAALQETELLITKKFTPIIEEQLYRNIKMAWRLNPKQLLLLQQLAIWRYQQAKKKDIPIGFVAKDHTLMAVAQFHPKSVGAMGSLPGIELLDVRHRGKAMLAVLKKAEQMSDAYYPKKLLRLDEYPGYKQIFKKVKKFITEQAELADLKVENLASKKQINQFLSWHFDINEAKQELNSVDLLAGWRLDLVGEKLQQFANSSFN